MLSLLRKDFSFIEDNDHPPAVPESRMSGPSSNQPAKPAAIVPPSDKLDPEAVAAFYARAVGMGPQVPTCAPGGFPPNAGPGIQIMTTTPRLPAWAPCVKPQPCLASFAPAVEQLVSGVAHTTAAVVKQTGNRGQAIPVSPILPCSAQPRVLEQGTVCAQDAYSDIQTPCSFPSVIMETPESFPSYQRAVDARESNCGSVDYMEGPKLAVSTGSEFQGFEPGSEKLAPDVDLFIRAESMRVLDNPSGLDAPHIQGNHAASTTHATHTMYQQSKSNPGHEMVQVPGAQSHLPASSRPITAPVTAAHQSGCIQGFGSGIPVASTVTTNSAATQRMQQPQVNGGHVPPSAGHPAAMPKLQSHGVGGGAGIIGVRTAVMPDPKLQGLSSGISAAGAVLAALPPVIEQGNAASSQVTPGGVQQNASLPSVILDTPMDTHDGHVNLCQQLTDQRSIIFDTPMDSSNYTSNYVEGQNGSNAAGTACTGTGHMPVLPNSSTASMPPDTAPSRVSDPVQPITSSSPGNRRRRRAHAPLDPAFMSASQEQQQIHLFSSSTPYPPNNSFQPAQQMRCPSELHSLPSTSNSDGQLPACGAAQAVTPMLRWERKSTELQLSGRVSGQSDEGATLVPNSGHQGIRKGSASAELHTPATLNGAPLKMSTSSNQQVHTNSSSLLPSDDYSRRLETYVPSVVADVMRRKDGGNMGDSLLHQWQVEVLQQPRVLSGRNVVYSAPTSGGKSLVAEIISLRRLYETNKAILLVLPFVALCNEKASHWEKLLSPLGYSVERYYGGQGRVMSKLPDKAGIAVCTIEKANGLINAMTEAGTLASNLSAVVVDELHMVDDEDRGYLLELLLTKLRFAMPSADPASASCSTRPGSAGSGRSSRPGSIGGNGSPAAQTQTGSMQRTQHGLTQFLGSAAPTIPSQPVGIQLIGMSATLPNVDLIGKWLDAAVHITNFRPVELQMSIFQGINLHKPNSCNAEVDDWNDETVDLSKWALPRNSKYPKALIDLDDQKIGYLVEQTVQERKSVLIFCGTIARVEQTAREIARFCSEGHLDIQERSTFYNSGASPSKREEFLKRLPKSTPDSLRTCISRGVGYHHGKMMKEHRDTVESAFKDGAISVLVATSTVATGVNLPAQRVIIRDNYTGKKDNLLSISRLRQMAGRAGRSGIDSKGECVCVLQNTSPSALNRMKRLMTAPPEKVSSCLTTEKRGMERIMLEVVATGLVRTAKDILTFIPYTLLAADFEAEALEQKVKEKADQGHSPTPIVKQEQEWQQRVADTCKTSLFNLSQQGFVFWKQAVAPRRLSDTVGAEGSAKRRPSISEQGHWAPHKLAAATLRANISPEEALTVNEDVASVARQLCLESDLHLMYLVAPVKASETLQWQTVYRVVNHAHDHCPVMRAVCKRTGVDMEYARRLGQAKKIGFKPEKGKYEKGKRIEPDKKRQLYKMYIALILSEIVNETPLEKIVKMFYPVDKSLVNSESAWTAHVARLEKDISSLQDEAGRSASMISAFCERIGLTSLELLVSHFHGRVLHGVKEDLVDLTNIKGVRGTTARLLYTAGLETVECIADASDQEIHAALCQGKRASEHHGEWKKARMILKSAIQLLQERAHAAKESLDEATKLLDRKEKENEDRSPLPKDPSSLADAQAAKARSPERQKRLLEPSSESPGKSHSKKHITTPPLQHAVTSGTTPAAAAAAPAPASPLRTHAPKNTPKGQERQSDDPMQPGNAAKKNDPVSVPAKHLKIEHQHAAASAVSNALPAASHGASDLQGTSADGTIATAHGEAPPQGAAQTNAQHHSGWQSREPGLSTVGSHAPGGVAQSMPIPAAPELPNQKLLGPAQTMLQITSKQLQSGAALGAVEMPAASHPQPDGRTWQPYNHQSGRPQAQSTCTGKGNTGVSTGVVNLQHQHRMPHSAQQSAAAQPQGINRPSGLVELKSSSATAALMGNCGDRPYPIPAQHVMHMQTSGPSSSSHPMQNASPGVSLAIPASSVQQLSGVYVSGPQRQAIPRAAMNMHSANIQCGHVQSPPSKPAQVPACTAMQVCAPVKLANNHSAPLPMPAPHQHAHAAMMAPYHKPAPHSNTVTAGAAPVPAMAPAWPCATSMPNAAPAGNSSSACTGTTFMPMPMKGPMQQSYVTAAAHVPVRPTFEVPSPVSPLQMLKKCGSNRTSASISSMQAPPNVVGRDAGHKMRQSVPSSSASMQQQKKAPNMLPHCPLQNQSAAQAVHSTPVFPGMKRPAAADSHDPLHNAKSMKYPNNAQAHSTVPRAQQQLYTEQNQHVQQHAGGQHAMQAHQWQQHSIHPQQQYVGANPTSGDTAFTAPLLIPESTIDSRATCGGMQGSKPNHHREDSMLHKNDGKNSAPPAQIESVQVAPPSGRPQDKLHHPPKTGAGNLQQNKPSEAALPAAVKPSTCAVPGESKSNETTTSLPDPSASAETFKAFFDAQPVGLHVVLDDAYMRGLCKAMHACSELGIELVQCDVVQRQVPVQVNHRLPPTDPVKLKEHHKALQNGSNEFVQDAQPKSYTTARGMVVCWDEHRCFFIMMKLKCRQENQKPVCLRYWKQLADAMESPVTKVGIGMKDMRNHLRTLGWEERMIHKFREEIPTQGLSINLSGELADVRVAASLLQPGSSIVSDAENTRQFPRECDADKHRVRKPAQNGKAAAAVQGPAEKLLRLVYQLHGWRNEEWGEPVFPSPASYAPVPSKDSRLSTEVLKPVVEAARELMHSYSLHCQLKPLLEKLELTQVLHKIEWPLGRVLGDMQHRGIPVDVETVDKQLSDVVAVQEALVEAVARVAKENGISNFGVPSGTNPKVRELLYDKLKIPPPPGAKNPNAKSDKLSTKAEVLQDMLNHSKDCPKVVEYIMDYRSLCKFREVLDQGDDKSSDLKTLLRTAQPFCISSRSNTGGTLVQVSTSFRQTQGDNGRLSTEKPNVQCAPKPKDFKFPQSCNGTCKSVHVNLRSIFRAPEGWSFLSADYCQMELRIMAHLAEEESLIAALNQVGPSGSNAGGIDPFTVLAQETGQDRADVKQLFYAVSYGMGVGTLSKKLGCDSNTAARWKRDLLSKFPKIEVWPRGVRQAAAEQGYLCTFAAKRRRWFPHINSSDNTEKGAAERAAVNFACQAGAADLTKWAMIKVEEGVVEAGLQDSIQMCLQVHDELVFLVRNDRIRQCARLVRDAMQGAACAPGMWNLLVPMTVKISVGPSWGELAEYK